MKTIFTLFLLIGLAGIFRSEAQHKRRADSVRVTIHLNNTVNNNSPVDSVLVIFDRYNLTGAGAIKKIFYPVNNKLIIENVPEGKFFIDIICLGIYHDNFSAVSFVYEKRKNKNRFQFRMKYAEAFNSSAVYIPAQRIDPTNLSVLRQKSPR